MAKSEADIKKAIARFAGRPGYKKFRIGIGEDARKRLQQQGVDPADALILTANTEGVARRVEQDLQEKGMDGGPGGGKEPKQVYVFPKSKKKR
ncbi:hypothetical protein ACFL6S_06560 [Candidatus Poribacteria bacterium]